jgi:hypothetical protein
MRLNTLFTTVGVAGLSIGLGFGLISQFHSPPSPKPRAMVDQQGQQEDTALTGREPANTAELADVQRRLANLERSVTASTASESAANVAAPASGAAQVPPSPEQERQEVIAQRDNQMRAFEAEHYDPVWSTSTKTAFRKDLEAIAANKNYKLESVDCKTTLCRAVVRGSSYDEVQTGTGELLHAMYRTNCSRTLFLPKPEDPNAPYEGTIVYDCTSLRAGDAL